MPAVGDRRHATRDRAERLRQAGEWLQGTRARRGLTAKELARRVDVAPQLVSNWETGRTAVSDEMAHRLAHTLALPVLTVRRGLRMWVPDEPSQPLSVDELIEQDPLLTRRDKDDLLSYLRIVRTVRRAGESVQARDERFG